MAKLLKLRRGTTTQHGSFTGAEGEVTIDTTKDTAVVHDGSTQAGRPLLREDMSNLPAGTIDNADVNASAAISGTKISPDFGSQDITTTGKIKFANVYSNESDLPNAGQYHGMFAHVHSTGLGYFAHAGQWIKLANLDAPDFTGGIDVTGAVAATGNISGVGGTFTGNLVVNGSSGLKIENTYPRLYLTDTDSNSDYSLINNNGTFLIYDDTNNISRLSINASGSTFIRGNITTDGTVDGRDVAADGTKLDGIESGSTGDQTAAEILTAIKTVDGSGSGLDADLLDGVSQSEAADASTIAKRNASGNLFVNAVHINPNTVSSGVTKIVCETGDDGYTRHGDAGSVRSFINVENGATADQTAGEIASALNGQNVYTNGYIGRDSNDFMYFSDNARLDYTLNGNNRFRFEEDGDFHADGNITAYSTTTSSDRKLKENIQVVPNALDKVQALNGVSFDWKKTGEKSAGVIAQDVQKVLPEAVKEVTPLGGGDSHLAVNYHALTSILIESIKELKAEIEELKGGK